MKKAALDIVRRVRLLWSKYYKRQQRRRDDGITTEEIAARYLGTAKGKCTTGPKTRVPGSKISSELNAI